MAKRVKVAELLPGACVAVRGRNRTVEDAWAGAVDPESGLREWAVQYRDADAPHLYEHGAMELEYAPFVRHAVELWMGANREAGECPVVGRLVPTLLAERCLRAFGVDGPEGPLRDREHWVWQLAAEFADDADLPFSVGARVTHTETGLEGKVTDVRFGAVVVRWFASGTGDTFGLDEAEDVLRDS